jgi:hypothetical protein
MFKISVTINYTLEGQEEEIDLELEAASLDMVWSNIKASYPTVTSVVLTFCTPKE